MHPYKEYSTLSKAMTKTLTSLLLLMLAKNASGQYLKLDNGITLSSFQNKNNLSILSSSRSTSYSLMLGCDYLQKSWFYLSSQVGYLNLGGKEINSSLQGSDVNVSESKSYIHLNTTLRVYTKSSNLKFFLGVGPYLNFLAGTKNFNSDLYHPYYSFKKLYVGTKTEIGITEDIKRIRVGLIGSYMLNLSPSASSDYLNLNNKTFLVSFTTGYRF